MPAFLLARMSAAAKQPPARSPAAGSLCIALQLGICLCSASAGCWFSPPRTWVVIAVAAHLGACVPPAGCNRSAYRATGEHRVAARYLPPCSLASARSLHLHSAGQALPMARQLAHVFADCRPDDPPSCSLHIGQRNCSLSHQPPGQISCHIRMKLHSCFHRDQRRVTIQGTTTKRRRRVLWP